MSFLDDAKKFFKKKEPEKEKESEKKYFCKMEEALQNRKISFDLDFTDDGYLIIYLDPFETPVYVFESIDDVIFYNGEQIEMSEALKMIEKEWQKDKTVFDCMKEEEYSDMFDMYDFLKSLLSKDGLQADFIYDEKKKELFLLYAIKEEPSLESFLAGIKKEKEGNYTVLNGIKDVDATAAFLNIIKKLYDEAPIFFSSGNFILDTENQYSDAAKALITNLVLVRRLNEVPNIRAEVTDVGKSNIIFVMFANGSAIEYLSPTRQTPNGQVLFLDYDENNLTEDNDEYEIIEKLLSLPTMLSDKPDENKMPDRNFSIDVLNKRMK